ncbi:NADP-dependent oxidoreductase [Solirubrobacter ginsenosidimutans]|uniref:NADP-dependent oxidoreductase n=1 Tax=Solirubrobacter ginsenosidimutans TaxID=490573 RepID=A0A9X3S4I4_9ACTN|nr:NADP-dependent oxidoreductase [Solirubrobacter ginsenosidimutans]MDA0166740.1 NADP-dependent oxidoreductase [Solirubrobacter ginsenosidimutans]
MSQLPTSMRALRAAAAGGPEQLAVDTAPVPPIGTGDVLVRVHAAGYTPGELDWPSTWEDRLGRPRTPTIPSHEVSGTVAAVGFGVAELAVGDEVFGLTDWYRDGAAAEFIAVEARNLARKPEGADHVATATLPLSGLTAWQGLFTHGGLSAGQSVIVHGAGGGVGALAVQLAHLAGAHVTATGRASVRGLATDLGADTFFDLEADDLGELPRTDVVFDTVGGEALARTKAGSRVVSIVEQPPEAVGDQGVYFVVEPDRAGLAELARKVDAGELTAIVGHRCPLDDAAGLIQRKHRGELPGKIVISLID